MVNSLDLLCLTDFIVLFLFLAPPPHREVQAMNKIEPVIGKPIVKTAMWQGNKYVVGARSCLIGLEMLCISTSLGI